MRNANSQIRYDLTALQFSNRIRRFPSAESYLITLKLALLIINLTLTIYFYCYLVLHLLKQLTHASSHRNANRSRCLSIVRGRAVPKTGKTLEISRLNQKIASFRRSFLSLFICQNGRDRQNKTQRNTGRNIVEEMQVKSPKEYVCRLPKECHSRMRDPA